MLEMIISNENYIEKTDIRAKRRKNNRNKAARKQHICKNIYGFDWYHKSLHQYSKNKIHCSCPMCRYRSIFEPDRKPMQDIKNLIDIEQQLDELVSERISA